MAILIQVKNDKGIINLCDHLLDEMDPFVINLFESAVTQPPPIIRTRAYGLYPRFQ